MKQLSALGARRHFFRNPRRMRALRTGMSPSELDDSDMMGGPGFGYFSGKFRTFTLLPVSQKSDRSSYYTSLTNRSHMKM